VRVVDQQPFEGPTTVVLADGEQVVGREMSRLVECEALPDVTGSSTARP
jgi:hypothetical protein